MSADESVVRAVLGRCKAAIETKKGEIAERRGLATSVLVRSAEGWRFARCTTRHASRRGREMTATKRRSGVRARLLQLQAIMLLAASLVVVASPALAHKEHDKKKAEGAQVQRVSATPGAAPDGVATGASAAPIAHDMTGGMDMVDDRSALPLLKRMVEWLGRLHPFFVHFPIAFFPAALFTAVVGRRRPAFSAPVQFLVVASGVFAPVAAAAGWLGAATMEPDAILTFHRWLGVAIGASGAALALWAWRRPWEDRGAGMILSLTAMTLAIAVQGFLGAAVTHGLDHLMF